MGLFLLDFFCIPDPPVTLSLIENIYNIQQKLDIPLNGHNEYAKNKFPFHTVQSYHI